MTQLKKTFDEGDSDICLINYFYHLKNHDKEIIFTLLTKNPNKSDPIKNIQ